MRRYFAEQPRKRYILDCGQTVAILTEFNDTNNNLVRRRCACGGSCDDMHPTEDDADVPMRPQMKQTLLRTWHERHNFVYGCIDGIEENDVFALMYRKITPSKFQLPLNLLCWFTCTWLTVD